MKDNFVIFFTYFLVALTLVVTCVTLKENIRLERENKANIELIGSLYYTIEEMQTSCTE